MTPCEEPAKNNDCSCLAFTGLTSVMFAVLLGSCCEAQEIGFLVSMSPDDKLQFTNITESDIPIHTFDLTSSLGFLIPIPPGDQRGIPDPFTFLLQNNPQQIIYGNLNINVTVPQGETWTTRLGYDLEGALVAGDRLEATYRDFDQSLAVQGICGLTAGVCPEPSGGLLISFATLLGFGWRDHRAIGSSNGMVNQLLPQEPGLSWKKQSV